MAKAAAIALLSLSFLLSQTHSVPLRRKAAPIQATQAKQVQQVKQLKQVKQVPKKAPVRVLPPVQVACTATAQNPPFRVVNCRFLSRLQVPVCVKFACTPPPGGNCPAMGGTGAVSNKACSWAITDNCTIPTPVYPSRGNTYGFGWITDNPARVTVAVTSYTRVGFKGQTCPP